MRFLRSIGSRLSLFFGSIRFRLTLWFMVILAVVLVVFSIFIYASQSRDLRSDAVQGMQAKLSRLEAYFHSEAWQNLGVSRLQVIVLDKLLKEVGKPTCRYVHLMSEVLEDQKQRTSDLACLVPPATMDHVTDIAGTLEKMPPKSTYFYPKLLTGLVFHSLK